MTNGNLPLDLMVRVDSDIATHEGRRRDHNEDYAVRFEPNEPADLQFSGCLYIVADGVGGARKGERASQYAAEKVMYEYYQHPELPPAERLRKILQNVGNEIYNYSMETGQSRMATTLVAAVVRGDRLTVANVGDSRAYLVRDGSVLQITHDHNQLSELLRSGAITEEQSRTSKVGNVLTRSLGGHQNVEVDIFPEIPLYTGDLLLLCSDGLHRYLQDVRLAELSASGGPEEIGQRLVDFANLSGGQDNITALVVAIRSAEGAGAPQGPGGVLAPPETLETMATDVGKRRPAGKRYPVRFRREYLFFSIPLLLLAFIALLLSRDLTGAESSSTIAPHSVTALQNATQYQGAPATQEAALTQYSPTAAPDGEQVFVPEFTPPAVLPGPTTAAPTQPFVEGQPSPEWETTALPLITQVVERGECVHKVPDRSNLTSVLEIYGIDLKPEETYYSYRSCIISTETCTDPRDIPPDEHDNVAAGEFIRISTDMITNGSDCKTKGGQWVNANK